MPADLRHAGRPVEAKQKMRILDFRMQRMSSLAEGPPLDCYSADDARPVGRMSARISAARHGLWLVRLGTRVPTYSYTNFQLYMRYVSILLS
jgi:hypothetical protein